MAGRRCGVKAHDPIETVLRRLPEHRRERDGWLARCPAHEDSRPSLAISRGRDGRALVHCRAGCTAGEVVDALGLRMSDLMQADAAPSPAPSRPTAQPTHGRDSASFATLDEAKDAYRRRLGAEAASWTYTNAAGDPLLVVMRWNSADGSKSFRPISRIEGRWWMKAADSGRPLYRLDELGSTGTVIVVEGEKTADALAELGFVVTTSSAGAKAAARSDWTSLAGRTVVVLPDEDEAGSRYAEAVRSLCEVLAPPAKVRVRRLPGLEEGSGEDAVEWIGRVHSGDRASARRALERIIEAADRPTGGVSVLDLAARDDALSSPPCIGSGHEHFDSAQPWGAVTMGALVVVGGEVGAGKSRFLINLALGFARQGSKVAYFLGEMDEGQAWRRAVCAAAGLGFKALTSPAPDHREKLAAAKRGFEGMDDLCFVRVGARREALKEWAEWADLLFIDPLHTLADGFDRPTEAERLTALMRELVALAADGVTVFASSEIGQGNGDEPELHNAFKGSSAIKQYATALYFVGKPDGTRLQIVRCFKQREGQRVELRARINPGWQGIVFEAPTQEGGAHG